MRFMSRLFTGIIGVAMVATVPAAAQSTRAADAQAKNDAKLAKALEGRTAGEPVRCISLSSVRSTQIIDKTAIIYEVGGKLYVNRPVSGASSLDDDDILVTKTSSSQLCDVDIVRLVDRAGHFPRGFVSLGKFVPYEKVKTAS
ncbi:hypothetical protein M2343_002923 [Sphingobium sp. B8D3B]|nr:hypothetical protein [Sphingobium sp. B8D3B]